MAEFHVVSSGAYSFTRQAKLLADYLGLKFDGIGTANLDPKANYIVVCNPSVPCDSILVRLRDRVKLIYTVTEGRFIDRFFNNFVSQYKPTIIAISNVAKKFIEQSGVHVDGVIHHMLEPLPDVEVEERTVPFLYIAGYLVRKFPNGLDPLFDRLADKLVLVTTHNNPYLKKHKFLAVFASAYDDQKSWTPELTDEMKYKLYAASKFYLNLSDAEGFGLTPLEACWFGAIPITEDIEIYREILQDNAIYVPHNGMTFEEYFPPIFIKHYLYDPVTFANKAISALIFYSDYKHLSKKCMEYARSWNKTHNYDAFRKFINV